MERRGRGLGGRVGVRGFWGARVPYSFVFDAADLLSAVASPCDERLDLALVENLSFEAFMARRGGCACHAMLHAYTMPSMPRPFPSGPH